MAIKGFQNTRTKAQNLTEIMFSQDGFLGGLNKDMPKSDVGPTQLTIANNVIPYRDRVEARGGIKPLTGYEYENFDFYTMVFPLTESIMYDSEFDAFFKNENGNIKNYDKEGYTTANCYFYLIGDITNIDNFSSQARVKDNLFFSSFLTNSKQFLNSLIEKNTTDSEYFVRPLNSDTTSISKINVYPASSGEYSYAFLTTFVRIVDDIVVAESDVIGKAVLSHSVELDGSVTPFSLYREANLYPQDYYDPSRTGEDNFYTHIRYYRTIKSPSTDLNDFYSDEAYYLTDYNINDADLLPGPGAGPTLNLNISDRDLISDSSRATLWQSGYQPIEGTGVACSSSGFFLCRNEDKKNEFIYCPIGSGDNRKYLGWYNPLYQYGSVDGDITKLADMGSYVLITTKTRTYYVDTVNYIENEGQRDFGIFTPILPSSVLISDEIGVLDKQRDAFVKTATGSAIALTSTGEVREFRGYQWGPDLTVGKVQAITKGQIYKDNLYCQASFVNDAYFLGYKTSDAIKTLRLGTTEESGYGFSEFDGEGWKLTPRLSSSDGNFFNTNYFYNVSGSLCMTRHNETDDLIQIYQYSGDGFDKKLSKDVIDNYDGGSYLNTSYIDIYSEIEFPEATGSSESFFLYFLKAHYYLRADRYSYKLISETVPGYELEDSDLTPVSLSDATFGMDVRIGESEDVVASNDDFEATSAVVMRRDVQDHRIRMTLRGAGAGFQLTGMEARFKRHNRTEFSDTETTTAIETLNTGLAAHITETLSNLAIGSTTGATFDIGAPLEGARIGASSNGRLIGASSFSVETGPDGNASAFNITGASEFNCGEITLPDYCVMFWSKDVTGNVQTGWTTSTSNDFAGNATSVWVHNFYLYLTGNLFHYVDGVFSGATSVDPSSFQFSESIRISDGTYSDVRIYDKALSPEELLFYIDNVLNNQGDYLNGY